MFAEIDNRRSRGFTPFRELISPIYGIILVTTRPSPILATIQGTVDGEAAAIPGVNLGRLEKRHLGIAGWLVDE